MRISLPMIWHFDWKQLIYIARVRLNDNANLATGIIISLTGFPNKEFFCKSILRNFWIFFIWCKCSPRKSWKLTFDDFVMLSKLVIHGPRLFFRNLSLLRVQVAAYASYFRVLYLKFRFPTSLAFSDSRYICKKYMYLLSLQIVLSKSRLVASH